MFYARCQLCNSWLYFCWFYWCRALSEVLSNTIWYIIWLNKVSVYPDLFRAVYVVCLTDMLLIPSLCQILAAVFLSWTEKQPSECICLLLTRPFPHIITFMHANVIVQSYFQQILFPIIMGHVSYLCFMLSFPSVSLFMLVLCYPVDPPLWLSWVDFYRSMCTLQQ